MFEISVIIPSYNEAENLENLVHEIDQVSIKKFKYEIIVVDDHSNDNTSQIIKEHILNNKIIYLCNEKNYGQSYSINKGIINSKYSTIVTIDGDGQNNPEDIPALLNKYFKNENFFFFVCIRKKRKDSLIKVISSRLANNIRRFILNDDCDDTGCSLKVFKKETYLTFPFFNGIHRFLPALFKGFGYKTMFIDVSHRPRLKGYSKYGTYGRLYRGIIDIWKVYIIIKDSKKNI